MKYAILEGERREAIPGLRAECPGCQTAMVAKCGERRIWHWAHVGARNCDHWWEPETEWHRAWKDKFPSEWQEAVQWADNGEKHVADVKSAHGGVLEFQHSYLRSEERRAREGFYGRAMAWVVDGQRLALSVPRFFRALRESQVVSFAPLTYRSPSTDGGLLRDWIDSQVPVFFDFGDAIDEPLGLRFAEQVLWLLHPTSVKGRADLIPVLRSELISSFRQGRTVNGASLSVERRIVNRRSRF